MSGSEVLLDLCSIFVPQWHLAFWHAAKRGRTYRTQSVSRYWGPHCAPFVECSAAVVGNGMQHMWRNECVMPDACSRMPAAQSALLHKKEPTGRLHLRGATCGLARIGLVALLALLYSSENRGKRCCCGVVVCTLACQLGKAQMSGIKGSTALLFFALLPFIPPVVAGYLKGQFMAVRPYSAGCSAAMHHHFTVMGHRRLIVWL